MRWVEEEEKVEEEEEDGHCSSAFYFSDQVTGSSLRVCFAVKEKIISYFF